MIQSFDDLRPRRSLWIPWIFVGGMFLVVVVNGGLIFAALSTFTGVTVGRSFDRGRTYNHVLQAAARQEALGWQAAVRWDEGLLHVSMRNREGLPVDGEWDGVLLRPLQGLEHPLDFRAAGRATSLAEAQPELPGLWEARLRFLGRSGETFEVRRRIIVP
jgi:nitrogen fixation protein FixH